MCKFFRVFCVPLPGKVLNRVHFSGIWPPGCHLGNSASLA